MPCFSLKTLSAWQVRETDRGIQTGFSESNGFSSFFSGSFKEVVHKLLGISYVCQGHRKDPRLPCNFAFCKNFAYQMGWSMASFRRNLLDDMLRAPVHYH